MDTQCLVAVFKSMEEAQSALIALDEAHFPRENVSLASRSIPESLKQSEVLEYGDESQRDALRGAGVGGLVGLLLGTPLLAIPGIGPLLLAGPIATGMTGAIVGHVMGAMVGWGVHEDHVAQYEAKLHAGKVLVLAIGDPVEVAEADRVLRASEAEEVHLHAYDSADSPEVFDTITDPHQPRDES